MATLPTPIFAETDPVVILKNLIDKYESLTNKIVQPSHPEQLILNAIAYEIMIVSQQIQAAGLSMLVGFSKFPQLDYLGDLVGATRLAATFSECQVLFTLNADHTGVTIPYGTRIMTKDNKFVFSTSEATVVPVGETSVSIKCFATEEGSDANGYLAGEVAEILDPIAFVTSASNTDTTSSGSDDETDEAFRVRIKLAPSSFSTAGPVGAYKFYALSANSSILDVSIPPVVIPGTVKVYVLVSGGIVTPDPILEQVTAILNDEKIRPLTDTVVVESVVVNDYDVEGEIIPSQAYLDAGGTLEDLQAAVEAAVEAYGLERASGFGRDIIPSKISAAIVAVDGVSDYIPSSPAARISVGLNSISIINLLNLTMGSPEE